MSGGSFFVSRAIWDHCEFEPEPFSQREAFLWLISEAAWKPCRRRAGRVVVDLKRGQLCASIRFMAEAWGWSKSRVSRFLTRIESRDMIGTGTGTGQLVITLSNYDKYQGERDTSGTRAERKAGHERDTSGTNENKGNKLINNTPLPPKGDDGFDAFWQEVPRKVAKIAARKAYSSALKKTDAATILDGMKRHAKAMAGNEARYVPHPSSWLNAERWADEEAPPDRKPPSEWSDKDRTREAMRWM